MKRFLLSMLAVGMMFSAVAQNDVLSVKNKAVAKGYMSAKSGVSDGSVVSIPFNNSSSTLLKSFPEELITVTPKFLTMGTLGFQNVYDRQTQGTPYEMMYVHKDKTIGAAWTGSTDANDAVGGRGIVYAYSSDKGDHWQVEYPVANQGFTYWPSYQPWGDNGELIVFRCNDVNGLGHSGLGIFRRESKGEGEWETFFIPNPVDNAAMVWHRCCTTGEHNEYLHVATGVSFNAEDGKWGKYSYPIVYNRSSDGGKTWDFEWTAFPDLTGIEWLADCNYTENMSWASEGNNIALIFAQLGEDCKILKSDNNGEPDSWKEIMVYECYMDMIIEDGQTMDSGYRALLADAAFDKNGKLHAVMSIVWARPDSVSSHSFYFHKYPHGSGLLYWNEDRGTYKLADIDPVMDKWGMNYFYWWEETPGAGLGTNFGEVNKKLNDTLIAGPMPMNDKVGEVKENGETYYKFNWKTYEMNFLAMDSYRQIGIYIWAHLFFDANNGLHMIYAGPLDDGVDGLENQRRHIFHTYTPDEFKTFNEHQNMNNFLAIKNNEFSYPYFGGWMYDGQFMYIAQVDQSAGTHLGNSDHSGYEHDATSNLMYAFTGTYKPEGIESPSASIAMAIYPNPATSSVTVSFDGTCSVEIYNMVGQKVYRVESVNKQHDISLQGFASGVYFVTVRDGQKMSTQKLIVQ